MSNDFIDEKQLFAVHHSCSEALDATEDALRGMLSTEDDFRYSQEAHKVLDRAKTAMRELLLHMESAYEFTSISGGGVGFASTKENICLE